mmetsp:Transcript_14870/g.32052  ORF Transcript_14870/g.32052 Transcript_14870/m.32052 type:complete len:102 (+) Transcript_14870:1064-1369(+)
MKVGTVGRMRMQLIESGISSWLVGIRLDFVLIVRYFDVFGLRLIGPMKEIVRVCESLRRSTTACDAHKITYKTLLLSRQLSLGTMSHHSHLECDVGLRDSQ